MKNFVKTISLLLVISIIVFCACNNKSSTIENENAYKILFLHHSTGNVIFKGGSTSDKVKNFDVPVWFDNYNQTNGTSYSITEQSFPKAEPYGWENYPYDYYNIWVKNAGDVTYMEEPTLEIFTQQYNMIIFKHCYPVSHIMSDTGSPDINSSEKRTENYKLQYEALKQKMHQFPETKFIVWTGAALLETRTNPEDATRAREFFNWVKNEWDSAGDNIFIWDFFELETEGGIYLKPANARSDEDPHPGIGFAEQVAPMFCKRIVDVIENDGNNTTLTGNEK